MMDEKLKDWNTFVEECGRLLVNESSRGIATREAAMPLLSVFLGEGADRHADVVRDVYQKCWHNAALLHDLTTEQYLPQSEDELAAENAEDEIYDMLSQKVELANKSQVMIAYYWDVADERYDEFKKQLEESLTLPQNTEPLSVIFAVCRDTARESRRILRRRRPDLIQWAREHHFALVLLSDNTYSGILDDESIWQAYQIAADIALMACSYYPQGSWKHSAADPGMDLRFRLQNGGLYGTAYCRVARDTDTIARVTLATALQTYKSMIERPAADGNTSIEDKISGGKGYQSIFHKFFEEHMTGLFPAENELEFLRYLPCVPQVAAPSGATGLFDMFRRNAAVVSSAPNAAYGEVCRDVQEELYQCDYLQPAVRWMESTEGKVQIGDWARRSISRSIGFEDIRSRLGTEATNLKKRAGKPDEWKREININGTTQEEVLHREFLDRCFCQCCQVLAAQLADEMLQMTNSVSGFELTVNDALNALPVTTIDPMTLNAYRSLTNSVLTENPEILREGIHPGDMASLQSDLSEAFAQIVQKKPAYRFNLQQELAFLQAQNNSPAAATDPLTALFAKDLKDCVYLQMTAAPENGSMYCLVNTTAVQADTDNVGEVFSTGQSDSIERLMLYPVDENMLL